VAERDRPRRFRIPAGLDARALRLAVASCALTFLSGCVLARLYREPLPPEASILEARTDDGWRIGLIHYRPASRKGLPVLLVHGVVNNGRVLDIDAEHSLARWFAAQGRETFVINLRGTRHSDQPDAKRGRRENYTIDTYVRQDLTAAVRAVLAATGAPSLDMVGHSMGGQLVFMYLVLGAEGVNSAATMGAQARFDPIGDVEQNSRRLIMRLGRRLGGTVPASTIVRSVAPVHGEFEGPFEQAGRQASNVRVETWKKFMANGVDNASREVFVQMSSWVERNTILSADGALDYSARLGTVRTPTLVVGGKLDWMAPIFEVRATYDQLGGPKRLFIAAEENGFQHDYGHGDLVMADRARLEVWPRLLEFFDEHAPAQVLPTDREGGALPVAADLGADDAP